MSLHCVLLTYHGYPTPYLEYIHRTLYAIDDLGMSKTIAKTIRLYLTQKHTLKDGVFLPNLTLIQDDPMIRI